MEHISNALGKWLAHRELSNNKEWTMMEWMYPDLNGASEDLNNRWKKFTDEHTLTKEECTAIFLEKQKEDIAWCKEQGRKAEEDYLKSYKKRQPYEKRLFLRLRMEESVILEQKLKNLTVPKLRISPRFDGTSFAFSQCGRNFDCVDSAYKDY